MPKYQWESKPPITRPDMFSDCIEVGSVHADDDERAGAWLQRTFDRFRPSMMRITQNGRQVRTIKSDVKKKENQ